MRQDLQLLTPDTHRYSLPASYRGSGWAGSTHLLSRSFWQQTGESRWGQFCAEQCPPLFQVTFSQSYEAIVALGRLEESSIWMDPTWPRSHS